MLRNTLTAALVSVFVLAAPIETSAQSAESSVPSCRKTDYQALGRNPTREELRCRFGVTGPGRFGLLSYADVPVYQPATPMPGTHLIGIPGQPRPALFESYEAWEWRVLRTRYGPEVHRVRRDLESLDPDFARLIVRFEERLAAEGIHVRRLETWRSPQRQAYLFQQGRSRPGPLATTTLTSWHSHMDAAGLPAGRAVDYEVPPASLPRFHQIAREIGLESYGADSHDPGHVFLPLLDAIPSRELVLLRTLPRVPEVTLATGLPVDEPLPPGGHAALRSEAARFAAMPFIPYPVPQVTRPAAAPDLQPRDPASIHLATDRAPTARVAGRSGRGAPPTRLGSEAVAPIRPRSNTPVSASPAGR